MPDRYGDHAPHAAPLEATSRGVVTHEVQTVGRHAWGAGRQPGRMGCACHSPSHGYRDTVPSKREGEEAFEREVAEARALLREIEKAIVLRALGRDERGRPADERDEPG